MKSYSDHMVNCPKCGSYGVRGPHYQTNGRVESIAWKCIDCGYTEQTKCKDARGD